MCESEPGGATLQELAETVFDGEIDPYAAADRLVAGVAEAVE